MLLGVASIEQLLYLYLPLNLECDARMYNDYARFLVGGSLDLWNYYRAPGYPAFLVATGQTFFDTFRFTIAAQALVGVVAPLLLYWTLEGISRRLAFCTAIVFCASTFPFSYAKLMMPEQVQPVMLLTVVFGVARYSTTRNPVYIYVVMLAGLAALMTRYEAIAVVAMAVVSLLFLAWRYPRHVAQMLVLAGVVSAVPLAWSWQRGALVERSGLGKQADLFGSLNNFSGRQLFWRVYTSLNQDGLRWEKEILHHDPRPLTPDGLGVIFVYPSNGPATTRIWDLVRQSAAAGGYLPMQDALAAVQPSSPYVSLFGRFDGNPSAFADQVFAEPNQFYNDWTQGLIVGQLGAAKGDELLGQAALEAVFARPVLLPVWGTNALEYFGIEFWELAKFVRGEDPLHNVPIFQIWRTDGYEYLPFNGSGCTDGYSPALRAEYAADHQSGPPNVVQGFFTVGTFLRNLTRNIVAPLFLPGLLLLPFARDRILALLLAGMTLVLIVVLVLGFNYSGRFEHVTFPFMLGSIAISVNAVMHLISRRAHSRVDVSAIP